MFVLIMSFNFHMSILLRAYYVILVVVAALSVYLAMRITRIPLDAFFFSFIYKS